MEKRKKILFVITKSNWGGAQKYVFDLATNLPKEKFLVSVALGGDGELKKKLEDMGVLVLAINGLERNISLKKDVQSFFSLYQIVKKECPDVIHINSSKVGVIGSLVARIIGIKNIVFTVHGWPSNEDRFIVSKLLIKLLSWMTVVLSHNTIVLGERELHAFSNWPFTKNKLVKIFNGLKFFDILDKKNARVELQEKYGVPNFNGYTIGLIAELHRNKGIEYLISSLSTVENVSLCIIGGGEQKLYLEKIAKNYLISNRVYFTGYINGANRLLKAFDLFVLPSIKEGLPYVLLEAGAASVPIISTLVGSIPEIIDNKITGLLVNPKSATELCEAIKFAVKNQQEMQDFATSFKKDIENKFSFNNFLTKTIEIYES